MGFISKIVDSRRIWKTLPDYPVYSPPFHDAEAVLAKREIKANYEYFLEQKAERLECLASYLRSFSVSLSSSEGLLALDGWFYRYGGHLVPSGGDSRDAMQDYEPAWAGEYQGINVVHDISIYAGDYIVSKNKNVRWDVNYGDGTRRDYDESGFGQPCLVGLQHAGCDHPDRHSIFYGVYDFCDAARWRLKEGDRVPKSRMFMPGDFAKRIEYLANPNPPPVIPFSQLTMDD